MVIVKTAMVGCCDTWPNAGMGMMKICVGACGTVAGIGCGTETGAGAWKIG
jgi:hypothetical protein